MQSGAHRGDVEADVRCLSRGSPHPREPDGGRAPADGRAVGRLPAVAVALLRQAERPGSWGW